MTQLTLPAAAIAAIKANAPYAAIRRAACMRLAQRIVGNPTNYTVADLADAHAVLRPTVLGEEVRATYHPPLSRNDLEKKYGQPS